MPQPETAKKGVVLRDQRCAHRAYELVAKVAKMAPEQRQGYKIAVNDLGANILRGGLVAATARLEHHYKDKSEKPLLDHLAVFGIPGLTNTTGADLPRRVRDLPTDAYILATRETLQVVVWLKRAVQATLGED